MTSAEPAVTTRVDFPRLPERWLAAAIEALPALAADIETQIRVEVPEFRDDPVGVVRENVRAAVEAALNSFAGGLAGREVGRHHDVFRRLGRLEVQAGRSHDTLQMAYRVATLQVADFLTVVGRGAGATPSQQADVRHAAIAFLEHLSSLSRAGYEEAELSGAVETLSVTRLLEVLIDTSEASRSRIMARAQQVGWSVPDRVRALEFVPDGLLRPGLVRQLGKRVGPELVIGRLPGRCLGFVGAEVDLALVTEVLPAAACVVAGPAVGLVDAASSARLAQRLSRRTAASPPTNGLVRCDDQMLTLFGGDASDVMTALAQTRLQPLEKLSIVRRVKAARVLAAMLEYGGLPRDAPELAGISPSTLQYRRTTVEELFGPALRDRDRRLELVLALRSALPGWEAELAMHERRLAAKRTN